MMHAVISRAVKKFFPRASIISIRLLPKGIINENYEVKLNGQTLIVRTYPKEPWKAQKEKYLYGLMKKEGIPVPEVYGIDTGRKIMPRAYLILSSVKGHRLQTALRSSKNKELIRRAGEILGRIHRIRMPHYGWIVDRKIQPAFRDWASFLAYDLEEKLRKLQKIKSLPAHLLEDIRAYFYEHIALLRKVGEPRLLHKDYQPSHILVHDGKITGIIDWEWAIAGHPEMDLAKTKLFLFDRNPGTQQPFLEGYRRTGVLSKDFQRRIPLYELSLLVSSLWFSHRNKRSQWFRNDLKRIRSILRNP